MSKPGIIDKLIRNEDSGAFFHGITTGRVISTDDPQQMGRLRVFTPTLDDVASDDIPWAFYGSPFSGIVEDLPRGRAGESTVGPVAYGMWAIPKVGSHVLIMCINGNPEQRVWLGCIPTNLLSHTMPHGRHLEDQTTGPLSSSDSPIQPLHTSQQEAFNSLISDVAPLDSEEYKTRGADNTVASIDADQLPDQEFSRKPDDQGGYQENRIPNTTGNDSNVVALVSAGFHSLSLDDNPSSCRIRIRTTAGAQIIFDDTNERIYLSTAQGKTWLEFDEKGTIDMYAEHDISIRSQADVNVVSDQTIRLAGKEGVHISSDKEVRIHSGGDMHLKSDANMRMEGDEDIFIESANSTHFKSATDVRMSGSTIYIESKTTTNVKAGSSVEIGQALNVAGPVGIVGTMNVLGVIKASIDVLTTTHSLNLHTHTYILPKVPEIPPLQPGITQPQLLPSGTLASATAAPAPAATASANTTSTYFPSRVPQHEPWARTYLDIGQTDVDDGTLVIFTAITLDPDTVSEYTYSDENVGRRSEGRGKDFERNDNWRR